MRRSWTAGVAMLMVLTGAAPASAAASSPASVPKTSTVLVLSTTPSAYGQTVTATATVTATPGPAQGDVVFSVDGSTISANLDFNGTSTVVLPRSSVGQHAVSATFVPQFPASQEPSTSPTETWVVAKVRTRLQVRVIGKGARIPTSVRVQAAGELGTIPTGRVTMVVRRIASGARTRVTRTLSAAAVALADFGKLRKGDYRVVVTYDGDPQHLAERRVEQFHVRQR